MFDTNFDAKLVEVRRTESGKPYFVSLEFGTPGEAIRALLALHSFLHPETLVTEPVLMEEYTDRGLQVRTTCDPSGGDRTVVYISRRGRGPDSSREINAKVIEWLSSVGIDLDLPKS